MLAELHIKDVALIDKAELEFFKGLNILSGETGAGKSMIIDAINFVLGQRATKDFVRNGEAKAQVEAVFLVEEKSVLKSLSEIGIECDDGTIVVQRILTKDGRNSIRINGSMVTVAMLKQISTGLIDVHGQHEHQSLLNSSKHIDILDKFCQKNLDPIKIEMVSHIAQYKKILKQLEALSGDEFEREEKIQNLQFKIKEIEDAQLKENEDTYLLDRKNYLLSIDKIIKATNESLFCLYFNETEHTATDLIDTACGHIEDLSALDAPCQKLYNDIIVIKEELDDLIKNLRKYKDNINQDPEELDSVDERLDMIYRLKKKYGPTLEDILSFKKQADEELRFIENSEEELEKLKKEKNKVYEKIKMGCEKMTMIRISKAKELQEEITEQLKDLEMKNATFEINITQKETFNFKGRDNVEFLISPNLGEDLKPLSKIASGGEISRVMLAIKTVVARVDTIDTFIFDEIDTGVSGNAATKVGEKMGIIGKTNQILCITHLPQIAAMADNHFLIEKTVKDGKTFSSVKLLDEEGKIEEISRLMGGGTGGEAVKLAAMELQETCNKFKKTLK